MAVLVAKVTDDFLLSGTIEMTQELIERLQKEFVVCKYVINEKVRFNECEIEHLQDGGITTSMIL